MSADRDTTRIVRSWLRTDEHESAARVVDAVLALLDTTPQRRPWWPTRRFANMNNIARLAIAAAAVVVAAVVTINLLPGRGGVGGPAVSPSPSPSPALPPSLSPSLRPEPTFTVGAFPAAGSVSVGRHAIIENGVPFSIEVSTTDWSSEGQQIPPDGGSFTKGSGTPQGVWMIFWSIDGVYADPCGHVPGPVLSPSAADLAAAVAGLPATDIITAPSDVTIGGRPAKHVAIRFRDDVGCSPSQYFMWFDDVRCGADDPCCRWVSAPGQRNDVWIVEIDGKHVWIEAETFDAAGPAVDAEVQAMIDSIQFE
jgi:hypothetical protein